MPIALPNDEQVERSNRTNWEHDQVVHNFPFVAGLGYVIKSRVGLVFSMPGRTNSFAPFC
jgi:hypothetical protein